MSSLLPSVLPSDLSDQEGTSTCTSLVLLHVFSCSKGVIFVCSGGSASGLGYLGTDVFDCDSYFVHKVELNKVELLPQKEAGFARGQKKAVSYLPGWTVEKI